MLLELDKNSRQSFSRLAKKLRVAKSVISYRIRQLEKKGIVQGYYTMIDTAKLGYRTFRAYVKLKELKPEEKEGIIQYLMDSKNVWWVATTTFPYDIVIFFLARTLHEFKGIWDDFLSKFKGRAARYQIAQYVEMQHFNRDFLVHSQEREKRPYVATGGEEIVRINEQETNVLQALSFDARAGTVTLGKKLKMSPITVKNIIRKMMKSKVILGFRVLINYSRVGYEYYWIHMDTTDAASMQKLTQYIAMCPETVYIHQTIGGRDVEFSIQVERESGIQVLLDRIFERYRAHVTDYDYFKIMENRKVGYIPPGWERDR